MKDEEIDRLHWRMIDCKVIHGDHVPVLVSELEKLFAQAREANRLAKEFDKLVAMHNENVYENNRLRELLRRASEQPHAPHSWPQDLWDAIDKELGT